MAVLRSCAKLLILSCLIWQFTANDWAQSYPAKVVRCLVRDFAPVTRLGSSPAIVGVHPSLPVKSIAELVRLAKAKPGLINFASAGSGTPTFLAPELFKM